MAKIGIPVDDVNGEIIGGNYGQAWVTYEGRQQGPIVYPNTRLEADKMLDAIVEELKTDCGTVFALVYPKQAWEYNYSGI